jgi:hypothetical protein
MKKYKKIIKSHLPSTYLTFFSLGLSSYRGGSAGTQNLDAPSLNKQKFN